MMIRHLNFRVANLLRDGRRIEEFTPEDPSQWDHFVPGLDLFSDELLNFLKELGLTPSWWEVFYSPPGWSNVIHIDSPKRTPLAKLNWVIGENNSWLLWYREKQGAEASVRQSSVETSYMRFNLEDVEYVGRSHVSGWPSVLESGLQPHQSANLGTKPRWCITMSFRDENGMIGFTELFSKLKQYEIQRG